MAQRYGEDYGTRGGSQQGQAEGRYWSGSRGSRSDVYDEPPLEQRDQRRGRSQHAMQDDDVPEVRFGRNVGDTGGYGREVTQRDFSDATSQGHHAGYGDYGQQDYGSQSGGIQRGGEYGGRGDFAQRGRREFARGDYRRSRGSRDWYGTSQFGSEREYSGPGSYRGLGPRGYTRSDERLLEIICEMLTEDPGIDASDIEVTVSEAVVFLDGTVDDRWTKYQVEEMAEQVGGVKDVRNQLRVQPPGSSQESSRQLGSSAESGSSAQSGSQTQDQSRSGSAQSRDAGASRSRESASAAAQARESAGSTSQSRDRSDSTSASGRKTQASAGQSTPQAG